MIDEELLLKYHGKEPEQSRLETAAFRVIVVNTKQRHPEFENERRSERKGKGEGSGVKVLHTYIICPRDILTYAACVQSHCNAPCWEIHFHPRLSKGCQQGWVLGRKNIENCIMRRKVVVEMIQELKRYKPLPVDGGYNPGCKVSQQLSIVEANGHHNRHSQSVAGASPSHDHTPPSVEEIALMIS